MKETQTPIPWQVAKSKIEDYTTTKWQHITNIQNFSTTHQTKMNQSLYSKWVC